MSLLLFYVGGVGLVVIFIEWFKPILWLCRYNDPFIAISKHIKIKEKEIRQNKKKLINKQHKEQNRLLAEQIDSLKNNNKVSAIFKNTDKNKHGKRTH